MPVVNCAAGPAVGANLHQISARSVPLELREGAAFGDELEQRDQLADRQLAGADQRGDAVHRGQPGFGFEAGIGDDATLSPAPSTPDRRAAGRRARSSPARSSTTTSSKVRGEKFVVRVAVVR